MMPCHRLATIGVWSVVALAAASADPWQKLRKDGAEVYYADFDLRSAFAKQNDGVLPESKRKPPSATAKAFDWTTVAPKHRVLAQKSSINCWAYAVLAAFEYNWSIRNGGPAPALAVQAIIDRVGKDGSGYTGWGLQDLLEHGTCPADAYPTTGKPGKFNDAVKMPDRAIAWGMVAPPGGLPKVEQIKQALVDHGPLVANVFYTPAFRAYKSGVFSEDGKPGDGSTNHILLIVGWDDAKGKSGSWKIQNSWGDQWGERGFMWIEYGSNNVGHSACWLRAQATHYALPADIHRQVTAATDPFFEWPGAKRFSAAPPNLPTLAPVTALKKQGERVIVQFMVQGGAIHPDGHVELFSEKSWRHEQCLIIRILKSELDKFAIKSDRALLESLQHKTIRVRGSVQMNHINVGNRPILEVGDPEQIKVVN